MYLGLKELMNLVSVLFDLGTKGRENTLFELITLFGFWRRERRERTKGREEERGKITI